MKNLSRKLVSCFVSSVFLIQSLTTVSFVYADNTTTEVYNEDFSEDIYTLDTNWITGAGTSDLPSGWALAKYNTTAHSANSSVKVIADPTNSERGNVLEIIPDNAGASPSIIKYPGTSGKRTHDAGKGLYLKQSMYIDKETASGLLPGADYHSFLFALPIQANLATRANTSSISNIYPSALTEDGLTVSFNNRLTSATSVPAVSSVNIPLDKWFDIEYYVDIPGIVQTSEESYGSYTVKYRLWIDGAYIAEFTVPFTNGQWSEFNNAFYGIAFLPYANGSAVSPVVYLDDVYAAYLPVTACITTDAAAAGDENGGSFSIEFSAELNTDSFSENLFSIEGVQGGFTDIKLEDDGKTVTFTYGNNVLEPDTSYVLKAAGALKDKFFRSVDEFSVEFTTNSFTKYVTPSFEITSYLAEQNTVTVVFSNKLEESSVTASAFSLQGVAGSVSNAEIIDEYTVKVTFDLSALESQTDYIFNITGLRDEYSQGINEQKTYTTPVFDKFVYSDDFSGYEKNVNWIGGTQAKGTDEAPAGWSIGPMNSGDYSNKNTVMVVDDPTGNSKGAVLKLEASKDSNNATVRKVFVVNGAEATSVKHDKTKNLYIKQSLYIDKLTASNYATVSDWFGSLIQLPNGGSNAGGHTAFTRIARNGKTGITETDFEVTYGSQGMTTYSISIPTGRWFDIEYIVNTIDEEVTKYDLWIDGVKVNGAEITGLRNLTQWANFDENFYGMAFSPRSYVSGQSIAAANPIMYIDDMYAAYVSPYVLKTYIESNGIKNNDTTAVKPNDTLVLEFETPLTGSELENLNKVISSVNVSDSFGNDVTSDSVIAASNENIKITMPYGFVYGRTYTVKVPELNIYNSGKQKFKGTSADFTVIPAKSGYISGYTLTTNENKPINTASEIELEVTVSGEGSKIYAAAYSNGGLKKVIEADVTQGRADVNFDTSADYIKLILLNNAGKAISDTVVINPLGKDIPVYVSNPDAEALNTFVSDAANSVLRVEAKTSLSGNNHYGFAAVFTEAKAEFTDYDIEAAIAFNDAVFDINGAVASELKLESGSGKYYLWLVTDAGIQNTEFNYFSISDIASELKKIAISDKSNADYVNTDDIYEIAVKYNEGLGLDINGTFAAERARNLLEYRVNEKRSTINGADDTEVIASFMKIVDEVTSENNFLNELENPLNKQQIEYILKNNTQYTGIDFTKYSNISLNVYYSFVGKTFANGDEVKKHFEEACEKEKDDDFGGSGGGGGKKSSGSSSNSRPIILSPLKPESEVVFTDIDSVGWAVDAINFLRDRKIVSGDGNSQFRPNDLVTRAEFAKMLVLALEKFNADDVSNFLDVKADDWFYPYVSSAYTKGIVKGYENGAFMPYENISRQDMAVMIFNSLDETANSEESFADEDRISEYARDAVRFLKKSNIVNGKTEDTFAPLDKTTRAEAAAVIYRVWQYVNE